LEKKIDILERELNIKDSKLEELECWLLKMKGLPLKLQETHALLIEIQ